MPFDPADRDKILAELIKAAPRQKLGAAMSSAIRERLQSCPRCIKCGMPQPGILDSLLHSDEQHCVYLVMES